MDAITHLQFPYMLEFRNGAFETVPIMPSSRDQVPFPTSKIQAQDHSEWSLSKLFDSFSEPYGSKEKEIAERLIDGDIDTVARELILAPPKRSDLLMAATGTTISDVLSDETLSKRTAWEVAGAGKSTSILQAKVDAVGSESIDINIANLGIGEYKRVHTDANTEYSSYTGDAILWREQIGPQTIRLRSERFVKELEKELEKELVKLFIKSKEWLPKPTVEAWRTLEPASDRYSQNRTRSVLPIVLNKQTIEALPDTMSSENIITQELARSINAVVDSHPSKRQIFTNACGGSFRSIGETWLDIAFPDEPFKTIGCRFSVLAKCAVPFVLGDRFLRTTETLTKFRHRLKAASTSLKKMWRLCYTDLPRRRLECTVDSESVFIDADTGSDIDLVSLEYASFRGWKPHRLQSGRDLVELSDGTVKRLSGYVDADLGIAGHASSRRFYVLNGLLSDVILGDNTIQDLDVFNHYETLFMDLDTEDQWQVFFAIKWKEEVEDRAMKILRGEGPAVSSIDALRCSLNKTETSKFRQTARKFMTRNLSAKENIQAWESAYCRALTILSDKEVEEQATAEQKIQALAPEEQERVRINDLERQIRYQVKTRTIQEEMNKFLEKVGKA